MSNGPPNRNKELLPYLRSDIPISTNEYVANQTKIAKLREWVANVEQSNEQAHQRYIQLELQKRVEEGVRAQQMLADMNLAGNSQTATLPHPMSFLSPPSTGSTGAMAYQGQWNPDVIPTTARIEEVSNSAFSQNSQQVGGSSTIRNASTRWNNQSGPNQSPYHSLNQPTSNAHKLGGNLLGRWRVTQPQQQQQQQQRQQQQQQHQQQHHLQQPYAPPQTTQYVRSSTNMPGQSMLPPPFSGQTNSGQGVSHPQVLTVPAVNASSSLEGALGNERVSSSSHKTVTAMQPNTNVPPIGVQGQPANVQRRQNIDKGAIAADDTEGLNYVSNIVITAQGSSSATLPKPPTRENRASAFLVPAGLSNASQIEKAEALVSLEPPAATSAAQVRSNTRHISTQRPSIAPVSAPPPQKVLTPSSTITPASSHTQAGSNVAPTQLLVAPDGVNSGMASQVPWPSNAYVPPSTSTHYSSVLQSAAPTQNQSVAPMLVESGGGVNWNYIPPGNQTQSALQGILQPAQSWFTQKKVPAISNAPIDSNLQARGPATPTNPQSQIGTSPRTPASADKKHLARDILRSLGSTRLLNSKRKRSEEPPEAAKRVRSGRADQSESDTLMLDSPPSLRSQPFEVDALPVHASALQNEKEEDEIEFVEDMISQPIDSPKETIPSSAALQMDDIIDISDNGQQNEKSPAKSAETLAIAAPVSSSPSPAQMVSSKLKEPLFLPSASSSPRSPQHADDERPMGDDNVEIDTPWNMPSMDTLDVSMEQPLSVVPMNGKKMVAYVLIPSPPDWVKRVKTRSNKVHSTPEKDRPQKHNYTKRISWVNENKDSQDEIEDWDIKEGGTSRQEVDTREADEMRRQAEATERKAVSLTSSLLRKQPCKWRYCNVVMNTIDRLSQHVAQHAQNKLGPFICLWQDCPRRFSEEGKLLAHLDSHVRNPILCPYKGCDLACRTPKELVVHCMLEHGDDRQRPSPKPFKPSVMHMPPVPLTLPSYMVVPRDVRQTPVLKDRHALLGPWVLRNIFGPVNLEVKRQNAAVPLRSSRSAIDKEDSNSHTIANDEYDFLRPKSPSSTPKTQFDDLASAAVSRLIHAGLTFWEPEAAINEDIDSPGIVRSGDGTIHDDLTMDDGGQQHEDLDSSTELLSAAVASTNEEPIGIPQANNNTSSSDPEAHESNEEGCVLV